MLIGYRGLAWVLVEDRGITGFPEWFDRLGQQPLIGPLPLSLVIFLVMLGVLVFVLQFSGFGRKVYMIGTNREMAAYSGVDVNRVKAILFRRLGHGLGPGRTALRGAGRRGARRHRARLRTRHRHHGAVGWGQHLRRAPARWWERCWRS